MVELVVQGAKANADPAGIGLIGGVVRAVNATDDEGRDIDESGEQEFMSVLACSRPDEELVEEFGAEGVLQRTAQHDREGAALRKAFKDLPEDHSSPPCQCTDASPQ